MRTLSLLATRLILTLSLVNIVFAQDNTPSDKQRTSETITAFALSDRVRFTSPSQVVQIRLEVYNSTGKKVFDNEVRGGNVLDWLLQDGQAERLADDTYLCAVTVKDLSGRLSQRIGSATLERGAATVRATEVSQMTSQQAEALGPIEENASLVVLKVDKRQTTTVIAHNGEEGQITRGRGALSFRIGDFYSGKDIEQMRLTEEGNLGIGITHPAVKLDVDGMIRASQGIAFPDGSIQLSAAGKTLGDGSLRHGKSPRAQGQQAGQLEPDTSGTGTTGKIPKWLDGPNGVLTDSNITEVSGSIGINGPPNPTFRLDVNGNNRFRGSNVSFNMAGLKPGGNEWVFQTVDADGRFRIFGQDNTTGGERFTIRQNGNVGIGTANPARPLEIATGRMRFSSDFGDIEFTEVADVIGHATTVNPIPTDPAFRVGTGTNSTLAFTVFNNGNVSIGTATAGNEKLRVESGPINAVLGVSTNGIGVYGITDNGVAIRAQSPIGDLMDGRNSSGRVFHITNAGTYVTGSDFAEALPARGERAGYEPGDVLVMSTIISATVEKSSRPYDVRLVGVYSTRPGLLGAEKNGISRVDADELPVAIVGIVPTKVSTENGSVQAGDLLTTSSTAGYAMKASPVRVGGARVYRTGTILGKALEPLKKGKGVIKVLVTLR